MQEEQPNEIQLRDSGERPIFKLSVRLIDTYKHINKVYYEAKAQKLREQRDSARGGVHNDGYDDQNYDYILQGDEILKDRYILKHKMGKGSFGQVVCAYDRERKVEVAIKIIKSRKPFLIQARTEIDILNKVKEKDTHDESNIVRLLDHFMYRNHQCLVFEILSFNLYELLKNTKFRGVSLSLIRKFSRHLLKSLEFLSRSDVDIIHCDLKPENILLRHPRRSAIKLIDFGSSCYLNKRTYSYIQSRFYRSPEVLLGLPYTQKIDVWSLGCVVVEMHTGEPLFGGANQADQICRIVDVLGMPPIEMIRQSPERVRSQFFERVEDGVDIATLPLTCDMTCIVHDVEASTSSSAAVVGADTTAATTAPSSSSNSSSGGGSSGSSGSSGGGGAYYVLKRPHRGDNIPKPRKLEEILGVYTGGPGGKRAGEADHSPQKYLEFLDFVKALLVYSPSERATPVQIATHPYMLQPPLQPPPPPAAAAADVGVNNNSAQQQVQEQPPAVAAATSTTTTSVANTEFAEIAGAVAVAASSSVHAPAAATTAAAAAVGAEDGPTLPPVGSVGDPTGLTDTSVMSAGSTTTTTCAADSSARNNNSSNNNNNNNSQTLMATANAPLENKIRSHSAPGQITYARLHPAPTSIPETTSSLCAAGEAAVLTVGNAHFDAAAASSSSSSSSATESVEKQAMQTDPAAQSNPLAPEVVEGPPSNNPGSINASGGLAMTPSSSN